MDFLDLYFLLENAGQILLTLSRSKTSSYFLHNKRPIRYSNTVD